MLNQNHRPPGTTCSFLGVARRHTCTSSDTVDSGTHKVLARIPPNAFASSICDHLWQAGWLCIAHQSHIVRHQPRNRRLTQLRRSTKKINQQLHDTKRRGHALACQAKYKRETLPQRRHRSTCDWMAKSTKTNGPSENKMCCARVFVPGSSLALFSLSHAPVIPTKGCAPHLVRGVLELSYLTGELAMVLQNHQQIVQLGFHRVQLLALLHHLLPHPPQLLLHGLVKVHLPRLFKAARYRTRAWGTRPE